MRQSTPCLAYLIDIVGEDYVVGITHRHERAVTLRTRGQILLFVFEHGFEHIHRHALHDAIADVQLQCLDAREGEQTYFRLFGQTALVEVLADASAGIAAHHGLATVGIEDAHGKISL